MNIESIKIKSGVNLDPMEDGDFPVCFIGYDPVYEKDFWLVCDSDDETPSEIAAVIMGIIKENKSLRKQLDEEKSRTNILNFGQAK